MPDDKQPGPTPEGRQEPSKFWAKVMGKNSSDRLSYRLSSDYLTLGGIWEPGFVACDAIALGLLAGMQGAYLSWLKDYYLAAFHAVVRGVQLEDAEETLALLRPRHHKWGKDKTHPKLEHSLEKLCLQHLLNLRNAALGLRDIHEGWLEGDPWLQHGPRSILDGKPYHPQLRTALGWWQSTSLQITRGFRPLDEAICALLRWDTSRRCSFRRLRRKHGFPDPEPVYEQWCDSL